MSGPFRVREHALLHRGFVHAAAHQLLEHEPHARVEHALGHAGLLEPRDVVPFDPVVHQRAEQRERRDRRARQVRRVHADHAGHALGVQHRHRPDHEAAPVVPREDRALDAEHVEQAGEVARQVVDVVGADRLGPIAAAVAALVGRDHAEARADERVELMPPRVRELREAVAQHDGGAAGRRRGRRARSRGRRRRRPFGGRAA